MYLVLVISLIPLTDNQQHVLLLIIVVIPMMLVINDKGKNNDQQELHDQEEAVGMSRMGMGRPAVSSSVPCGPRRGWDLVDRTISP